MRTSKQRGNNTSSSFLPPFYLSIFSTLSSSFLPPSLLHSLPSLFPPYFTPSPPSPFPTSLPLPSHLHSLPSLLLSLPSPLLHSLPSSPSLPPLLSFTPSPPLLHFLPSPPPGAPNLDAIIYTASRVRWLIQKWLIWHSSGSWPRATPQTSLMSVWMSTSD